MWNFKAELKLWPTSASPWHYIDVPSKIVKEINQFPLDRGLLKISAQLESIEWQTAVLPAGKNAKIIPVKADIRKKLELKLGDKLNITIAPVDL